MRLRGIPLAWLQLRHEKLRLLAAVAGIAFAVVLVFAQLGFRAALFDSSVRFHKALDFDLVMMSPKSVYIGRAASIPRRRLYQALGLEQVSSVAPVYIALGLWRNPVDLSSARNILVVGFDPAQRGFSRFGVDPFLEQLKKPDNVLFDRKSRPEFGPVPALLQQGPVDVELNERGVRVVGTYLLGTSFGIDGSVMTSDLNFQRAFPERPASHIHLGLIFLKPGVDIKAAEDKLRAELPDDVDILTREEFIAKEVAYWNNATPIGYVFTFGVVIGLVVGLVIVYQILFSDVQDHLQEYATLKAMGYKQSYLNMLVLKEAVILAVAGFIPGILLADLVYAQAAAATNLPLVMTTERAVMVLVMTVVMCALSGLIALRKVRSVDPAEVF